MARITGMFDMPDRLAENLIRFIRQNSGKLSKRKREKEFHAMTDAEVQELEAVIQEAFENFDRTVSS